MSLTFNGEEVVLLNIIREGKDAWSTVYAVPKKWAEEKNIEQYDWEEITSIPEDLYKEALKFPNIEELLTRVWEV